jgi:hypothetical protein
MTMADPAAEATIPPAMTMADPAAARTVDDRLARPRVHRIDMRPLVERLEGPASNSVQVPPLGRGCALLRMQRAHHPRDSARRRAGGSRAGDGGPHKVDCGRAVGGIVGAIVVNVMSADLPRPATAEDLVDPSSGSEVTSTLPGPLWRLAITARSSSASQRAVLADRAGLGSRVGERHADRQVCGAPRPAERSREHGRSRSWHRDGLPGNLPAAVNDDASIRRRWDAYRQADGRANPGASGQSAGSRPALFRRTTCRR